jgi:hypothetical protein
MNGGLIVGVVCGIAAVVVSRHLHHHTKTKEVVL